MQLIGAPVSLVIIFFLPRIQLGAPIATTASATTAIGCCHRACDVEDLQGEPLASAYKDATGPGMANLGAWDREGGLSKRKEVELDLVDSSGRISRWPRLQNVYLPI